MRKQTQEDIRNEIYNFLEEQEEPMYARDIYEYLVINNLTNNLYISIRSIVQWLNRDERFNKCKGSNGFKKWGINNENE